MPSPAVPVGVIGLGLMGRPMALNLARAGFPLTVWSRRDTAFAELAGAGATIAGSAAELAGACDLIITMLPDAPDVESVLAGDGGVFAAASRGSLIVDMSTIGPAAARRLHGAARERGLSMLDAPVSGGDVGAKAATLTIMVGGDAADFARARPVFAALGQTITHCGPAGAGQLVKACNQIVVTLVLDAISEAIVFARAAGVDPAVMMTVLQGGSAYTRTMERRGPSMAAGQFSPGFKAAHQLKDLRIVLEEAARLGITLPGAAHMHALYAKLVAGGGADLDNSAVLTVVEQEAQDS